MGSGIKRILIAAGSFIGVLLVMCLAAGILMQDASAGKSDYDKALEKLSGEKDGEVGGDADIQQTGDELKTQEQTADSEGLQNDMSAVTDNKEPQNVPSEEGQNGTEVDIAATPEPTETSVLKHRVVINAAHQSKYVTETEPIGPGASKTKYKAITGATGVSSGVPEYKVNLAVAQLLRDELVKRGYEVYMIRESDDVNISDCERAKLANENGEIVIHIHANADESEGIKGIMAFYPSKDNEYAGKYSDACRNLCSALLTELESATRTKNWGPIALDTQTALNWTTIPAAHVEVGYLSNTEEDKLLQTEDYRKKIAAGLADGVDAYFME